MLVLGLDIATETGWALLDSDDGSLVDYGLIRVDSRMALPQRLHYFHLEITRLCERTQPVICFIEDVILGISGAKTLAYLGRLNGVAINAVFGVLQERVELYKPTEWKANSFAGLGGMAKKWQIQLACIKHFNIPITGNFEHIDKVIYDNEYGVALLKESIQTTRGDINKLKSSLVRKRNPLPISDINPVKESISQKTKLISDTKARQKSNEKVFQKAMSKISLDISAQTGMTPDICDSCGVAVCGIKQL
jgi:Holliday junction resolvasome RuvABC endonuclease subunit